MRQTASPGKKPKVAARRHLRATEANQLIDAAGQRGRHPFRDKVLVHLVCRHGLWASEAVGLYLPKRSSDARAILVSPGPKVVSLHYIRSGSKEQVQDRYREGEGEKV